MVLKTLVAQIDVLETMTPMSFLTFRDWLEAASGFQSIQFRELEYLLLGHKRPAMPSSTFFRSFRGYPARQAPRAPQARGALPLLLLLRLPR